VSAPLLFMAGETLHLILHNLHRAWWENRSHTSEGITGCYFVSGYVHVVGRWIS